MILQALAKLYSDLLSRGDISAPGWSPSKVAFALCIDETGQLKQIVPLLEETTNEKGKTIIVNQIKILPAPVKRTSGILANFLCDNSSYLLGTDAKGNSTKSLKCFLSSKELHLKILQNVNSPAAVAIIRFFSTWNPEKCNENSVFLQNRDDLLKGGNLIFRVNGIFAHEDPEISAAWQEYYDQPDDSSAKIQCLVNGGQDALELVHPAVKGVLGAQSSGAALVSFNASAFCSYNREQGENAPIGKKAAFAYTTALNYLLSDKNIVQRIGETTIVSWADNAEPQYSAISNAFLFSSDPPRGLSNEDLWSAVKKLARGEPCEELSLLPSQEFYILGLSPNAARLSVRFFWKNTFGTLIKNINEHYERLKITGTKYDHMPLWALLRETANLNSKDKTATPVMGGATARAIFNGERYPASLLENVMLRIRAERKITPGRAAIIKAYYTKNTDEHCPKEVLTVSLNENSTNIPYIIGRLFAVYEAAQEAANPNLNSTIKDKYFNSVASSPSHILPILNNLFQHHLRKMSPGLKIIYEKQVGTLMEKLTDVIPSRLSLPEQGAFQLGYYHQRQKRFKKKGE